MAFLYKFVEVFTSASACVTAVYLFSKNMFMKSWNYNIRLNEL